MCIADLDAKFVFNPAMMMGGAPPNFAEPSTPAEPAAAATEPAKGISLRREAFCLSICHERPHSYLRHMGCAREGVREAPCESGGMVGAAGGRPDALEHTMIPQAQGAKSRPPSPKLIARSAETPLFESQDDTAPSSDEANNSSRCC